MPARQPEVWVKADSPAQLRGPCPRPACHPWSREPPPRVHSWVRVPRLVAGGSPWRVLVPSAEASEGWRVAEQLCIVGGRASMDPSCLESAWESLYAGCTRGLSLPELLRQLSSSQSY